MCVCYAFVLMHAQARENAASFEAGSLTESGPLFQLDCLTSDSHLLCSLAPSTGFTVHMGVFAWVQKIQTVMALP